MLTVESRIFNIFKLLLYIKIYVLLNYNVHSIFSAELTADFDQGNEILINLLFDINPQKIRMMIKIIEINDIC